MEDIISCFLGGAKKELPSTIAYNKLKTDIHHH